MKITDYEKKTALVNSNVFLIDGPDGTKTILAHDLAKALMSLMTSKERVENLNLSDLVQTASPVSTDKLLIGTGDGVKGITANDALFGILDACAPVELRRNIFRGKSLGTALTSTQKANIANGTFKGFFLGDYWEIGGRIWRIVDFNYWLNSGDTSCTTPHLVIMPDSQLYTAQMNETNVTTGGYVGSKMYTENLENAKTLVNSAFGAGNILNHREYLTNAVTDGHASAGAWFDSTVEIPNEIMMYGSFIFTAAGDGTFVPNRYTIDKTQLALMAAYPRFINPSRQNQWLRDVVSAAGFAFVDSGGHANGDNASAALGVRVVFGLRG